MKAEVTVVLAIGRKYISQRDLLFSSIRYLLHLEEFSA